MSNWPSKDADELLDYKIDWSSRLADDTIVSSEWIVPGGIEGQDESNDETSSTIWLGGGTLNLTYKLINRIMTLGGRIMEKSATIAIRSS